MIKVAIAGIRGKMGQTALEALTKRQGIEVVAAYDYKYSGLKIKKDDIQDQVGIPIYDQLDTLVQETSPDVFFDVTRPDAVFENVNQAIDLGLHIVVGTSGLTESALDLLRAKQEQKGVSVVLAPNFSIGAVLMMKFAGMAANYLEDVEIIEMHHNEKVDAPSGTAMKTAQLIQQQRTPHHQGAVGEEEQLHGARGADIDGMKIHSVRLQGLLAHQKVLFGSTGELLTIQHDSFSRDSFKKGIVLAVEYAANQKPQFIYGLENVL